MRHCPANPHAHDSRSSCAGTGHTDNSRQGVDPCSAHSKRPKRLRNLRPSFRSRAHARGGMGTFGGGEGL